MADDDDVDIYGDLTNFGEKSSDNCSADTLELKKKCTDLEDKVVNLEKELESLRKIKNTLEVNLSSLVKTAKTEIARKDRMITELRSELENSLFRRNNYRIPKINRNNDSNSAPNVRTINSNNHPTPEVGSANTHAKNIEPVYLKPFTVAKNDDNDNDDEDGGGEIYQPNKFASTVYGERLRKKLIEQEAAERLKKEQLKSVTLTNVNPEMKEEPGTNSTNINRDNKENQFCQIAPNEVIVDNPIKKSLKRSNDGELDGHHDKREKLINHKNENVDGRDDKNSENMHTPAPVEPIDKKIDYRLEPIESLLKHTSQSHQEEPIIQKNINGQRDNHRDKYRKRRSHSRSRSRDNSNHSGRRKNSDSRNRESSRRRGSERSDYHRSGSDRDIRNKYENRRDPRHRVTNNFSSGSKRVTDLRNHIDHHRGRGDDRRTDRHHQERDERKSHENRRRSGGLQHNRNDSQSKSTSRNINKRDRSKSSTETFSDRSNDSFTIKRCETQTLPQVNANIVTGTVTATCLNSLEEGEIVGSPISTPRKDTVNNIVSNKELDKTSTDQGLDRHLLATLSVETPKLNIASRTYLKSPQEENIENIAGFIRNFACHDVANEPTSMIITKLPVHRADSLCNTTKSVAEVLECETNNTTMIASSDKSATPGNIVMPSKNNNEIEHREPLSPIQLSANIVEDEESVNNIPSKPKATKIDTISINNVSTSYADVLSKYIRKKKKSTTSDSDSSVPEKDSSSLTGMNDVKDEKKSEKIIHNESVLPACSKEQQDNKEQQSMQENTGETFVVPVSEPLSELPCEENVEVTKDIHNTIEIRSEIIDTMKIDVVESVRTKLETSKEAAKSSDVEIEINCTEMKAACNNDETIHNVRKDEKLMSYIDAPILEDSNSDKDSVNQVVCTATNTSEELCITEQRAVNINDEIINGKGDENNTVKLKKKCLEILSENICERKCEDNAVKNTEDKINDCKKLVSTPYQNEKKIVVARRKKRPVQLTNSSNSLTVVLSAYNVNNNRICKSRMKTPVTLSDT